MRFTGTGLGFVILVLFGRLSFAEPESRVSVRGCCVVPSAIDSILRFEESICDADYGGEFSRVGVVEGDEATLQKANHLVYSLSHGYVAVLFYASWCPFSRTLRPSFSALASLYPYVPHFAIEELAVRPSILSKYGVHGFPTLFLLNSTMRVRYRGSRSLGSLVAFYSDFTGIKTNSVDRLSLSNIQGTSDEENNDNQQQENCPFSWARSPENLLRQETYLALATTFVLLRLLYFLSPYLLEFTRCAWRRYVQNVQLGHPHRALQLFNSLRDPYKRSNLQEGAINARAWASKSLASAVAIGDASTSRGAMVGAALKR